MNRFKHRLTAGGRQWGLWMSLASPIAADAVSRLGYDWLLCDTEHAPLEVSDVLAILQAADSRAEVVVLPAWNDRVLIKRCLDLGARTLLIPFVETARDAVAACRYPPDGVRGVAGSMRASGYGTLSGYHAGAADEIAVVVQVETRPALDRLEGIARVDGVDAVFIGPSDLAASFGHLGHPGHQEVQSALKDAAELLRSLGMSSGILATSADKAADYARMGYDFIAVGTDVGLMMGAAKNALAKANQLSAAARI